MAEQITTQEQNFPEELRGSRVVGTIPTQELAWMSDSESTQINVSELDFAEGKIYLASAIPKSLSKITQIAASKDPSPSAEDPYSKLDRYGLMACRLEASGLSGGSAKIKLLNGSSGDYGDFSVRSFSESPKPNARRMYYAYTSLSKASFRPNTGMQDVDENAPLMIRICWTDKQNQIKALRVITGKSTAKLKDQGAGAV